MIAAAPPIGNFTGAEVNRVDEAYIFTPPGFDKPGKLAVAEDDQSGQLHILVRDKSTGEPTPCRINVVGPDGNFYQPTGDRLQAFGFTGNWPAEGTRGNRLAKGPIRYLGWFFYSTGDCTVNVPAGQARIEVWKGFEYRPVEVSTQITVGQTKEMAIDIEQTLPMVDFGYHAGDPHIHLPRRHKLDDLIALDLMEAEGIYYGSILCYNEPPGPYTGIMDQMDMPQARMGIHSVRARGPYTILSGQEYRSSSYGHLNLHLLDELVLKDLSVNADNYPIYGELAQKAHDAGGVAIYAHGGYALEIYADAVQENIDAVELLQFSMYRGIGLEDWYRILNAGFRLPITGASDYPACRKLGDCKTYVYHEQLPGFGAWYHGVALGQSFVTSGPMLLLEVDGQRPGATINRTAPGNHSVTIRVNSEVAPVTNFQLIVGGKVVEEKVLSPDQADGKWYEFESAVQLGQSSWIAARAFSKSPTGTDNAESHTNPVYVIHNDRAPYRQQAVDALLKELDRQIAFHQARDFDEKAKVIDYFLKSKDILQEIRKAGGRKASDAARRQASPQALEVNRKAIAGDSRSIQEILKSIPPKSPAETLETFEVVEPFHLELVAHEPLVTDPICGAFDENGLLYVGEMTDYPYFPQPGEEPLGSVRVLEDTDGDGQFDESHVFADRLLWVGGIAPWKQGIFVAAPPDIWYLKDTDGDHKADLREKVFTGFGTQNQQGMLNNLKWGPDHKIYGSSSVNGGMIRPADDAAAEPVPIDGNDFRFSPGTKTFEAVSGKKQFGNSFDDWGNRFICSQAHPILHVVLPHRYLLRIPYLPTATTLETMAEYPTPVYRTSPIEAWREIRSRRRIVGNRSPASGAGVSHHVIDGAAGVTIYRGGTYPQQFYGNAFIGEAQNNLIHRRLIEPNGVTFTSKRGDKNTEFVRSTDNWFRPVNFLNAPDGTLYVLDMSREILEAIHIPLDVVKHLDLRNGRDRGRIYRIAPHGFRNPEPPRLGAAETSELVDALASPHGWCRDTAHRLLYERQDMAAINPLRRLLASGNTPQARFNAFWSLAGLRATREEDLFVALGDEQPAMRAAALRLAEPRLNSSPNLRTKVFALQTDSSAQVRFQLALTLGETDDPRASEILAAYAKQYGQDHWMRTAILSSITSSVDRMMIALLQDREFRTGKQGHMMLEQMGLVLGAQNDSTAIAAVVESISAIEEGHQDRVFQRSIVQSIGTGLKAAGARLDKLSRLSNAGASVIANLIAEARKTAADMQADVSQRRVAISLLGCVSLEASRDLFDQLLSVEQPVEVQLATLEALGNYDADEVSRLIINLWPEFAPAVLNQAVQTLLRRQPWTRAMLQAALDGKIAIPKNDAMLRDQLLTHPSDSIQSLGKSLFANSPSAPRQDVVDRYRAALPLDGNVTSGQGVFTKTCSSCHTIAGIGNSVGPDLTSIGSLDPEAMLTHILDPNRYVLPKYVQYVVLDSRGRSLTGMISSESATSITLVRDKQASDTVLRTNIDQLIATGRSLMPEGLEQEIDLQQMADLIAFITDARQQRGNALPSDEKAARDFGTLPGLVEPKDE